MYELGQLHVPALQSDAELIKEAFKCKIRREVRPKLCREKLRTDETEAAAQDDEPVLVLEGGIRTDSSVGYPVFAGET